MNQIINLSQTKKVFASFKKQGKSLVLVGGCFDVLHLGHLKFLEAAKKHGDILIVALENDENVKRLKGENRPVNNERNRAERLIKTGSVDLVILLPSLKTGPDYLQMVQTIKPDTIAITAGDPQLENKQKQAKIIGGEVKVVINRAPNLSTTNIIKGSTSLRGVLYYRTTKQSQKQTRLPRPSGSQ